MGLFNKLFGKNKAADAQAVDKKALGLKEDVELTKQSAAPAKQEAPRKTEAPAKAPEQKKDAEGTDTVKEAVVTQEKPKTPQASKAPAKKESAPKDAPKAEATPEEDTSEDADKIATAKETVSVGEGGGRFEIKKSKDGRFVFNLYAKNHVIVATSQIYSSSTSAVGGIKSVIINAPIAAIEDQTLKTYETQNFPKWEIYLDKGQQYRFRLCAPNGSCICHSQGYTNKTNCKNGIQSIIRSAKDASIDKIYLKKDNE